MAQSYVHLKNLKCSRQNNSTKQEIKDTKERWNNQYTQLHWLITALKVISWRIFNLQLCLQWCILHILCFIDSNIYFMYDIFVYFICRFYKNRTVCFYSLKAFKTHTQCQCNSSMWRWKACHVQTCLLGGTPCEAVVFPGGADWETVSRLRTPFYLYISQSLDGRDCIRKQVSSESIWE